MLTDNEKHWLQLRKLYAGEKYLSYYSCMHCPEYNIGHWSEYNYPCNKMSLYNGCPLIDINISGIVFDYIEAAEFEARLAAKLESIYQHISNYWIDHPCDACPCEKNCNILDCDDNILKYARLAVEMEMDADEKSLKEN